MTVAELIKVLQDMPQKAEVFVEVPQNEDVGDGCWETFYKDKAISRVYSSQYDYKGKNKKVFIEL